MQMQMTQPDSENLNQWLKWSWRENRPMALLGVGSLIFLALTLVGLILDPRTVLNEPTWLKPMKFGISSAFYAFTLLWMLTFIDGRKRAVGIISWITAIGMTIELVLIGFQALRGVRSHFNFTTPMDAVIFSTMGTVILIVWFAGLALAVLLVRQKFTSRPLGLALTLGMIIATFGASFGYIMPQPTAAQMAEMQVLQGPSATIGAHSVGVEDGGAGLPILGWSTEGGDIRIAHFIGLHGLQMLPLIGWFIMRNNTRLREKQQMQLIWVAGIGYAGIMFITLWQAMRGQPLIAPDSLTLTVTAGLLLILGAASIAISSARR